MSGKIVCDDNKLKRVIKERYIKCPYVIDVSDLDTSKCISFEKLFYDFKKLRFIKGFNTLDTSNVQTMYEMCYNCWYLTSLNLSGLNLSNVVDIQSMCFNCHSLTSLNLSGLNLSNVQTMKVMCCNCYTLTSLNLSGLNLSNIINMHSMCCNCHSLTSLNLSGLNLLNARDIGGMCDGCWSLKSLNLSGLDLSNVEYIHDMCRGCPKLSSISQPKKFPTEYVKIQLQRFIDEVNKPTKALKDFDIHDEPPSQQVSPYDQSINTLLKQQKDKLEARRKAWEEKQIQLDALKSSSSSQQDVSEQQIQLDAERIQLYNDNMEFQRIEANIKAQLEKLLSLQTAFK